MNWQLIESAPKDGTAVTAYQPINKSNWMIATMYFINDAWHMVQFHSDNTEYETQPTHWMPLPPPPEQNK